MRACVVLALVLCCATTVLSAAERESFPYTAFITADEIAINSGPADHFYTTAKLRRGDPVEVYRLDPGGWCAIRPPEGSFCYVNAANVTKINDRLARVNTDRVPARVGSGLSNQRDAIQVYLKQNESLEVLGADTDQHGETWLKIAPPAGEFRWIQERNLTRQQPSRYDIRPTSGQDSTGPVLLTGNDGWVAVDGGNRSTSPPPDNLGTSVRSSPRAPSSAADSSSAPGGGALQWELDQIDVSIARIMVDTPDRWNFGPLRLQTEALQDRNLTSAERTRVREMLNKIDHYEDLRRRSSAFAQVRDDMERRFKLAGPAPVTAPNPWTAGQPTPAITGPTLANPNLANPTQPKFSSVAVTAGGPSFPSELNAPITPTKFDAVGFLSLVKSVRQNAPTFALMESPQKGAKVVAFVSPGPGVNLLPLVGQLVGVQGDRGYIPEFEKPHVTARLATITR